MNYVIDNFSLNIFGLSNFANYTIRVQKISKEEAKFLLSNAIFHIKNENVSKYLSSLFNLKIETKQSHFKYSHCMNDNLFLIYAPKDILENKKNLSDDDIQVFRIIPTFEAPIWNENEVKKRDDELSKLDYIITESDLPLNK